jgi:cellulose synthase/poly-beta-1,6-N-acetylglucosamine synthase-like glycosyltransferase
MDLITGVFAYSILLYSVVLLGFYVFIALYSVGETRNHLRKASFTNYNNLLVTEFSPTVSLLAPAYNEEATIVENVRSLLNIHYDKLEIIIINDGSKDNTLKKVIDQYDMVLSEEYINCEIDTKEIRGIYRSTLPVYSRLIVVDKVNGGKADALNVGINVSTGRYIVCIDVDCILEQDAIIKLMKPFLEPGKKRVIATGGVIRIANSCVVRNGMLEEVRLPKNMIARMQTLEYIRSFLLARMAWARMDGLLLISGAFGAFDREIVIKAGGYNHATVGEDMELVVRMRRYMHENKLDYTVSYIPDPLCWTEVPSDFKILGRQRNRWMRGTIETLQLHRKMFFNPKYGILGMLSYPYWFFFELMAPVVETIGMVFFLVLAVLGLMNWTFFFLLLLFILCFGFLYSLFAILMEVATYNEYKKDKAVLRLMVAALLEPLIFHPFVVWSSIRGIIDLLRKKKSWGDMTRKGFSAPAGA